MSSYQFISCANLLLFFRVSIVKKQVWLIDGGFVMEPFLGGQLLGELGNYYDMPTGVEVIAYTQEQFDQMCEEFYEEHGHYPDQ